MTNYESLDLLFSLRHGVTCSVEPQFTMKFPVMKDQFPSAQTVNVFGSENFKQAPLFRDYLFYTAVFTEHILILPLSQWP